MESTEEEISQTIKNREKWGQLLQANLQVEGVDDALLDKRTFLGGVWMLCVVPPKELCNFCIYR